MTRPASCIQLDSLAGLTASGDLQGRAETASARPFLTSQPPAASGAVGGEKRLVSSKPPATGQPGRRFFELRTAPAGVGVGGINAA